MFMKILFFTCLIMSAQAIYAFDDEPLHPHVHGLVEMTLVAEKSRVEISINSPLVNLVGFEHHAQTEAENAAVKKMATFFSHPENWLHFSNTSCKLKRQLVNYGNEAHHHQHDTAQHTELKANYQFICDSDELDAIEVLLQQSFPAIESIGLSWLVNGTSGITSLHHDEKQVDFSS